MLRFTLIIVFIATLSCNTKQNSQLLLGDWVFTNGDYRPPMKVHISKTTFTYLSEQDTVIYKYKLVGNANLTLTNPGGKPQYYKIFELNEVNLEFGEPNSSYTAKLKKLN